MPFSFTNICPACDERVWSESYFCHYCGLQIRELPPVFRRRHKPTSRQERERYWKDLAMLLAIYLGFALAGQLFFSKEDNHTPRKTEVRRVSLRQ